jgi:anti-sigma factor RsiW
MTCEDFLARHSEYLDDELSAVAAAGMRQHMAACERCARYDRVLRRGLALVRELEPVAPADDPYAGLQRYLARRSERAAARAVRGPLAATVAVAGVLALFAWSALFRATGVPASASAGRPAVEARPRAAPDPTVLTAGLGLSGIDVVGPGMPVVPRWPIRRLPSRTEGAGSRLIMDQSVLASGPYTPLVVEPPDYGQAVAVAPVLGFYGH